MYPGLESFYLDLEMTTRRFVIPEQRLVILEQMSQAIYCVHLISC